MKDDDFIRQRLRELREQEASAAPSFQRVLQRRAPRTASPFAGRLAWASAVLLCALVLVRLSWRSPEPTLPEPSWAAIEALEAAEASVPSDALLVAAEFAEASALAREIEAMLSR